MNKCKNCKHWKEYQSGIGNCSCSKFINVDLESLQDKLFYSEYFSTGPEFGCVHYENKNN